MNREGPTESFSLPALQAGDRAEFARLVEATSGAIYRLALKMLADPQDAEDVLQETYLQAYRHLSGFDGRARLTTWLYRIAVNQALMMIRKRRPGQVSIDEPLQGEEGEGEPLQIVDWCCLPEEELLSAEGQVHLDRAVEKLPESLRVVFLLRDIEGLSTRETAGVLDLSETAVKTRLSRARLRLREDLSAYYAEMLESVRRDDP
jgi:RNA polymerase sigma-70 factor (ECF subfamily)